MIRSFAVSTALLLLTAAGSAVADPQSFVGAWHWNKAESTLEQGEPAPKDIQLQIAEAANGKLRWSLTEIDPAGGRHVESFDGPTDGSQRPVTGGDGHTTAGFTVTGDQLSATFKGQGGSDAWSCTISPDQRKMTCKGTESDSQGHTASYADVYDRA